MAIEKNLGRRICLLRHTHIEGSLRKCDSEEPDSVRVSISSIISLAIRTETKTYTAPNTRPIRSAPNVGPTSNRRLTMEDITHVVGEVPSSSRTLAIMSIA